MSRPSTQGEHPVRRRLRDDAGERAVRSDAKASRKTLLAAARELFAERGPDALTIVEVAKRAGLNRSTAYQHFRSREELTQAVADAFAQELRELLGEPRDFGEQIEFFVQYFSDHPDIARLWMFHLLTGKSRAREGWGDFIESLERIATGSRAQSGIDAEMLGVIGMTSALVWSVMAHQHSPSQADAEAETLRFAAELKRLLLVGTLRPEHLQQTS